MKSFAAGPSSSISAPKKAMQVEHQASLAAAKPTMASSLRRWRPRQQRQQRVGESRCWAPHPALWATATAPVGMERALILLGVRLARLPHACPHQDPRAAVRVRCRRGVAAWRAATAISGWHMYVMLLCARYQLGADDFAYAAGHGRRSFRSERATQRRLCETSSSGSSTPTGTGTYLWRRSTRACRTFSD